MRPAFFVEPHPDIRVFVMSQREPTQCAVGQRPTAGMLSVTKRIRPDANVALRQAQGDILLMMWDRYYFLNLAIMFLIFFT